MSKALIIFLFLCFMSMPAYATHEKTSFHRNDWGFRSYKAETNIGFYTGQSCERIDIDHVVSLKDANHSGGEDWTNAQKKKFANDKDNHVVSCAFVNRSKGASAPQDFLRKASDGKGRDYRIIRLCTYLKIYQSIKQKYQLENSANHLSSLHSCP